MEAVALGEEGIVEGLRPGSIYVDLTTTSPTSIELVNAAVVARGALMVDAPVMGDRASIGELQHSVPVACTFPPACTACVRLSVARRFDASCHRSGRGVLTVLTGGATSEATRATIWPVMERFASRIQNMGELGCGTAAKLSLNM